MHAVILALALGLAVPGEDPSEPNEAILEMELQAELSSFPPAGVARDAVSFWHSHRAWLREQLDGPCAPYYIGCLRESDRYGRCWIYLEAARDSTLSLEDRRANLKRLRFLLIRCMGEDAVRQRRMPPPAPFWRFIER
jgi:hypothetical protein